MAQLLGLSAEQVDGIRPFCPKGRGVKRVEDRKVLSGIIPVIQKGLRWVDAPAADGPHKTFYNRPHHAQLGLPVGHVHRHISIAHQQSARPATGTVHHQLLVAGCCQGGEIQSRRFCRDVMLFCSATARLWPEQG